MGDEDVTAEPNSAGVEAVASLPDRIAQAITDRVHEANFTAATQSSLPVQRTARQVLHAAVIDRRVLAKATDAVNDPEGNGLYGVDWLTPARRKLADLAARYGVTLDG